MWRGASTLPSPPCSTSCRGTCGGCSASPSTRWAAFFAFLAHFGIDMTVQGANQYATIFEMTMTLPFAAVPVSSALVCLQLFTGIRDFTLRAAPAMLVKEAQ